MARPLCVAEQNELLRLLNNLLAVLQEVGDAVGLWERTVMEVDTGTE